MGELRIKSQIIEAMKEPSPPEQLVRSMTLRAGAIIPGRRAEQRLEAEGATLSQKERTQLAAASLVGRLAQAMPLPGDASPQELTMQLSSHPRFQKAVERGNLLLRLRNGELLQELSREGIQKVAFGSSPEKREPARNLPVR
ncbi:MAG: hypothetical protein Q4B50_03605, partial [Bacillota bacterium]|nr:hypothetical protein [Bacillota bacterium]